MPRAKAKSLPTATGHPEVRFSQETRAELCQILGPPAPSPPAQNTRKKLHAFFEKGETVPGPQGSVSQVFKAIDDTIHIYQGLKVYVDGAVTPAQQKAALDPFLKICQTTFDLFHELSAEDAFEDTIRPQVKSAKDLVRYTQTMSRFPLDLQTIITMMQDFNRVSAEASQAVQLKPRKVALHQLIHTLSSIFERFYIPSKNTKNPDSKKRKFIHIILNLEGILDTSLTDKRIAEILKSPPSL